MASVTDFFRNGQPVQVAEDEKPPIGATVFAKFMEDALKVEMKREQGWLVSNLQREFKKEDKIEALLQLYGLSLGFHESVTFGLVDLLPAIIQRGTTRIQGMAQMPYGDSFELLARGTDLYVALTACYLQLALEVHDQEKGRVSDPANYVAEFLLPTLTRITHCYNAISARSDFENYSQLGDVHDFIFNIAQWFRAILTFLADQKMEFALFKHIATDAVDGKFIQDGEVPQMTWTPLENTILSAQQMQRAMDQDTELPEAIKAGRKIKPPPTPKTVNPGEDDVAVIPKEKDDAMDLDDE